ncbi:MAG: hypothetical protein HC937_00180 [Aquincola sp.]|nr:hypothetical protein [Aquincola sp.]
MFQNLLNPASPYLTLTLNLAVAAFFLLRKNFRVSGLDGYVLGAVLATLLWLLLVVVVRGDAETQTLLKYFRISVAILLFSLIATSAGNCARSIITGLNFSLGFHVALVFAQIAFPDLTYSTALLFGFEREPTILEEYTLRKLGASSSYDTASLLSVAGLLFFYLQFVDGRGTKFACLAALSFIATLFSSRTGMALSLLIVLGIMVTTIVRASPAAKLAATAVLLALSLAAYVLVLPLLLQSLGYADLDPDQLSIVFSAADYGTTGTLEALTDDHLKPLDQPLLDLFLGHALDPNSIHRYTDIGYVKLIYHVGIPGTAVILSVHFYMLFKAWQVANARGTERSERLVARLLSQLLLVGLVFNYKSLELYSRGFGDILFMLFFFVAAWSITKRTAGQNAEGATP